MKQHKVPYFVPSIGEAEIESVVETLRSGWLTTGPKTKEFEQTFAERVGARHAIAVNSATSALHLGLEAHGIGPGDEVLVPTLTFASTGEVAMHLGAKPVLVDCLPGTLNIDPDDAERRVTPRTKAIMPVHYGGQPVDLDRIHALATKHDLAVIEDAAHALPSKYDGRPIGGLSPVTCFSFYANKTITTGEGGMATTNDDRLAERMRIMALHGISKDAWKRFSAEGSWFYEIMAPGYKYNMTDIAAALGLRQLARCDEFWRARVECAEFYREAFSGMDEVRLVDLDPGVQNSWHLFVILLRTEMLRLNRARFIMKLNEAGVGTSVHYTPLHMHPLYRERFGCQASDFPVAQDVYARIISLPIYPGLSRDDQRYVVETVGRIARENHT